MTLTGGTVDFGRLTGSGSDILGNISLTANSILRVGGGNTAATATLLGNLSVDTTTLQFGLNNTTTPGAGVNGLLAVSGNLTLAGTNPVTISALGGPLATGSYTLITYGGTLTGSAANFAAPTGLPPGRQSYAYDTTSTPGSVLLNVTGTAGNLTWVGDGTTNAWDTTTAGVWTGATPNTFFNGDIVNFTDSGAANSPVNLTGTLQPFTININASANYTFAGTGLIGGTAVLNKSGTGTLFITNTGVNTFNGATTISAGIINLQTATGLGVSPITVASGAALQLQGGISVNTQSLTIAGTGVSGNGALQSVSGSNTWNGTITQSANSRIQSDAATLTIAGNISGVFELTIGGAGNTTISGRILTGASNLNKVDAGTLQSTGTTTNTYSGTTIVTGGTLQLNKTATVNAFAGNLTIGDGTNPATVTWLAADQIPNVSVLVNANATLNLNGFNETTTDLSGAGTVTSTATAATLTLTTATFSGQITGAGLSVVKANAGIFTLTGLNNNFGGTFQINNGTAVISKIGDANNGTGAIKILNGNNTAAELQYVGAGDSTSRAIDVFANGASASSAIITASGTGPLVFTGGASRSDSTGTGAKTLVLQGTNTGDNTLGGVIADGLNTLRLNKAGTGTWVLTGASTYTGPTTVTGGLLKISGSITSAITVGTAIAGTGTLRGTGAIGSTFTVAAGGTLAPGFGTNSIGTLTAGNSPAAASVGNINGAYQFEIATSNLGSPTPISDGSSSATQSATTGNNLLNIIGNSSSTFNFGTGSQIVLVGDPTFNTGLDNTLYYSWKLASIPTGTTVTGLGNVTFDTTAFNAGSNFSLSLASTSDAVVLNFAPVPEPHNYLLLALCVGLFLRGITSRI